MSRISSNMVLGLAIVIVSVLVIGVAGRNRAKYDPGCYRRNMQQAGFASLLHADLTIVSGKYVYDGLLFEEHFFTVEFTSRREPGKILAEYRTIRELDGRAHSSSRASWRIGDSAGFLMYDHSTGVYTLMFEFIGPHSDGCVSKS